MGEYWKPVNVTKHEYIHPHRLGCGLKLVEWHTESRKQWLEEGGHETDFCESPVEIRILDLFRKEQWVHNDDIRAVSDYGGCIQLYGKNNEEIVDYYDLDETFKDVSE